MHKNKTLSHYGFEFIINKASKIFFKRSYRYRCRAISVAKWRLSGFPLNECRRPPATVGRSLRHFPTLETRPLFVTSLHTECQSSKKASFNSYFVENCKRCSNFQRKFSKILGEFFAFLECILVFYNNSLGFLNRRKFRK